MVNKTLHQEKTGNISQAKAVVLLSVSVYLIWTIATYLLEGRINLLQQPTIVGRYTYVLLTNVLIGTVGAIWLLRSLISTEFVTVEQLGFRSLPKTIASIIIAVALGFGLFLLNPPPGLTSIVVINGFAQTLTVSIAELVVCWLVIGVTFETLGRSKGKMVGILVGIVTADLFFSVYHLGHSAPFNQVQMMLMLLIPGLLTGLFFFFNRELYATILFHNFLATIGVVGSLDDLTLLSRPLYPFYALAFISVVVLIVADILLVRRSPNIPIHRDEMYF